GILDGQHLDLAAVDEDGGVLGADFRLEVAVDGIVLQQMGERLGIGQIVDADHLDVASGFQRRAEEDASDAPETVDADSNAHGRAPCGTDRETDSSRALTIGSKYTASQRTRATVSTPTRTAPAARSIRAHSAAVAPVVSTSSTSTT